MALAVTQVETWAATLEDRPGGMAAKLDALAKAGANLEFAIARRIPEKPGKGVLFVIPITGATQTAAAKAAGFAPAESLHTVRIAGPDAPGLSAKVAKALADAGINLRGVSGAAIGGKAVFYLALDTKDDAAKVAKLLKGLA